MLHLNNNTIVGGFMSKMRVVQVSHQNGSLELVERQIPKTLAGWVRIKVQAAAYATATLLQKRAHSLEFNTRESLDTK